MINWARVSELHEEIGAEDFDEVVTLFLQEVDEKLSEMVDTRAQKEFGEGLHFLKGSAMNLGFSQLAQLCDEGEKSATSQGVETLLGVYKMSKIAFFSDLSKHVTG